jgi:hypothetical protein
MAQVGKKQAENNDPMLAKFNQVADLDWDNEVRKLKNG